MLGPSKTQTCNIKRLTCLITEPVASVVTAWIHVDGIVPAVFLVVGWSVRAGIWLLEGHEDAW